MFLVSGVVNCCIIVLKGKYLNDICLIIVVVIFIDRVFNNEFKNKGFGLSFKSVVCKFFFCFLCVFVICCC